MTVTLQQSHHDTHAHTNTHTHSGTHWLVFKHLQWGTAESTESTLAGQKSTLGLPLAVVKVHLGIFYVDYTTPPQTLWGYTGSYLGTSKGAPRKVLNRPWLVMRRREFIDNYSGRVRRIHNVFTLNTSKVGPGSV